MGNFWYYDIEELWRKTIFFTQRVLKTLKDLYLSYNFDHLVIRMAKISNVLDSNDFICPLT